MAKEHIKLLAVGSDLLIDRLAKAVYSQHPTVHLFFAQTVKDGFVKFARHDPHILILQLKEPSAAWHSFLLEILKRGQCSVLLISIYSSGDDITRWIRLGVKDVLVHPVNYELLLCKLATIILMHNHN